MKWELMRMKIIEIDENENNWNWWECIKKSYIYDGFTLTVVSFALELHENS